MKHLIPKFFVKPVLISVIICALWMTVSLIYPKRTLAQSCDSISLGDYIVRENFPDHSLSTGESIRYTNEGGSSPLGSTVRQYKNDNWEQFIIGTDNIYRREDTSWRPQGATHSSGDATCKNGNKAIYTLDTGTCSYTLGQTMSSGGAEWAPLESKQVGSSWSQQLHNIVPINAGVQPGVYSGYPISDSSDLKYCEIDAPPNYPACSQAPSLTITGCFDPGQFTFCSGVTNPSRVVMIGGSAGAGSNDGFIYMEDCGLAGFTDENLKVGITSGCGIDESAVDTSNCSSGYLPPPGGWPGGGLGRRPLSEGWELGQHMCRLNKTEDVEEPEFHPLRPYPINACDPLIPQSIPQATNQVRSKYNTYACGTSINFEHKVAFDPYFIYEDTGNPVPGSDYIDMYCDIDPKDYECHTAPCPVVTCYKTIRYEIETDFRDSNIGILGNTQRELTDPQKVNNYLSWYLAGTPQVGDHEPLDKLSVQDMDRLVNYSGPLRKLLPFDAQNAIRSQIAMAYLTGGPENDYADLHDYEVGCKDELTITEVKVALKDFLIDSFETWGEVLQFVGYMALTSVDSAITMGETLVLLSQQPYLLESENIGELKSFFVDQGYADLSGKVEFLNKLIALGVSHVNIIGNLLSTLDSDYAVSCGVDQKDLLRLSSYKNEPWPDGHLPPDPLTYDDFEEFWKDYNNWRGLTNVPLIGPQDWINPLVNGNVWSQLFPNIPLGGLEDVAGEVHPSLREYEVGPAAGSGGFTAPPQLNIIEAERARASQP